MSASYFLGLALTEHYSDYVAYFDRLNALCLELAPSMSVADRAELIGYGVVYGEDALRASLSGELCS